MSKPRITPFAQVLRLVQTLSDSEKATLRDVLRPEPTPRGTKKASRKARAANAQPSLMPVPDIGSPQVETNDNEPMCAACGNGKDFQDHFPPSPHYHAFDSEKKAAKSA